MLPGDTKQRREAATDTSHQARQTSLANHFPPSEAVIPYSNQAFEAVAIGWLIRTNQVCRFLPTAYCDILIEKLFSPFRHSRTPASRRCWTLHPVQCVVLNYHRLRKHAHALCTCSSNKCACSRSVLMYVFILSQLSALLTDTFTP
jgi:hypothetical protein